jgi:ADP-ribose pyrophosphatase YjhB (NUDIX family)
MYDLPVERRWGQRLHPLPSVLALVRPADETPRYLLIRRQKPPYKGLWALVGGKWDFGEAMDMAVTREVREETGLQTAFVALRGLVNERIAPEDDVAKGCHFLLFVCEVQVVSGEAQEQGEGPVGWFTPVEMAALHAEERMIATDYAIVKSFGINGEALPYVEVEVIAGEGGALTRFERQ